MNRALVRLRPLAEEDVDHILTWVNDREVVGHIAAFSGEPFSREQELAYVRRLLVATDERAFSIEEAATGRYLGQAGIHQIHHRSRVGRLSCIIGARSDHGQGYGTAAIAHLLDLAFGSLGLHKVWLMVFEHNLRARRTYGRMGFLHEGLLREEYFHEGTWHNMLRMALLEHEWEGRASRTTSSGSRGT